MSAPGAVFFFEFSAVFSSFIEKFALYALSLSNFVICSNTRSIWGSCSVFRSTNSLEYDWLLLIFTYSFVKISAFCLLSVYLMLFTTKVFVGLKGFPLIFLIIFHIVLLSVLWFRIEMNSIHLSFLFGPKGLLFLILIA